MFPQFAGRHCDAIRLEFERLVRVQTVCTIKARCVKFNAKGSLKHMQLRFITS